MHSLIVILSATLILFGAGCAEGMRTIAESPHNRPLDIDHMLRGHFYASSPREDVSPTPPDWCARYNCFRPIDSGQNFVPGRLTLEVRPDEDTLFYGAFPGMKVYVANTAEREFYFEAQDRRLYMAVQARDRHGRWRDIEYLPNSWCGNSYHTLRLPANRYWVFATPLHDGEYRTTFRIRLLYQKELSNYWHHAFAYSNATTREERDSLSRYYRSLPRKEIPTDTLYSNEFPGGVNRWQFSKRLEYHPRGIMDPYEE